MVIDIPAHVVEDLRSVDWSGVKAAVADYAPVLTVLRDTWDRETLKEIADGHLFVRDAMINDAIAQSIGTDGNVTGLTLTSHADGRLDIVCTTNKKYKRIELSGTLEEIVHDSERSYAVYRVRKKNIPHHGIVSWVFSRISLSMVERMVGRLDVSDRVPVDVHGNRVHVDFHAVLAASRLGRTEFRGHRLIDMVEIEGAKVRDGGILFDTKLNVPDDVKDALRAVLQETDTDTAAGSAAEGGAS